MLLNTKSANALLELVENFVDREGDYRSGETAGNSVRFALSTWLLKLATISLLSPIPQQRSKTDKPDDFRGIELLKK